MENNPLKPLHDLNPIGEYAASLEWMNIVSEWNDMSGAPLEDMMILSILSQATKARFAHDEQVVQSMLDQGVDPETAFDRVTNWTVWAITVAYAAYNLGRGKDATPVAEAFLEFIASLEMNS